MGRLRGEGLSQSWSAPEPLDQQSERAAVGCLRVSTLLRRLGLDSAWRFRPGGDAFAVVSLEAAGIRGDVAFPAEDLAIAADDGEAASELARQAIAEWRRS